MSNRGGGLDNTRQAGRPGEGTRPASTGTGAAGSSAGPAMSSVSAPPSAPPLPPHQGQAQPVLLPDPPDPPPQTDTRTDVKTEPMYEKVEENEENDEEEKEIRKRFEKLDIQKQQKMLKSLGMGTTQVMYPTAEIEEMYGETDMKIEDTEERANRIHRKVELSDSKLKDLEDLETVTKYKIAEKNKQEKLVDELGETRDMGTRYVMMKDTFDRIKDGRVSDPEDVTKRIQNLGEYRIEYAKVKKKKKEKTVKLVDPKQEAESDSDEFFESQESFVSESEAKPTKKRKKKTTNENRPSKVNRKTEPVKVKEDPPPDPSSSSSDESDDSDSEDTDTEEEEEDPDDPDEEDVVPDAGQSLVKLANNVFNKKLQRTLLQLERLLKRAGENKNRKDKAALEKVKTELASAMSLLDKAAIDEQDGTKEQWANVEMYYEKVSRAQEENLNKLKNLEADTQRRAQLPKATLETWNGEASTLQAWIIHLKQTLTFDDDLLNVASLKKQVAESKEKKRILRRLQYCTTLDQCFSKLQKFYGSFEIALPNLKAKIEALPDMPDDEVTESANIEELLFFVEQMEAHKKSKKIVNQLFINQFLHKLTKDRAKEVTDKKIKTCKKFKKHLEDILESNQQFNSTKPKQKKSPSNVQHNATEVEKTEDQGRRKSRCPLCQQQHALWDCDKLKNQTIQSKKRMIQEVGRCFWCFRKHTEPHSCGDLWSRWKCNVHKCNTGLCGCSSGKPKTVQHNSSQVMSSSSDSLINGTTLGSVGFFSENIEIKSPTGSVERLHVTYDTLASHSTGDESVLKPMTKEVVNMGVELKIKTYLGESVEPARKCEVTIKTCEGDKKVEFLVSKKFENNIKSAEYKVPKEFRRGLDLKEVERGEEGKSFLLIGVDLLDLHPEMLKQRSGLAMARSRITGKILFSGKTINKEAESGVNIDLQLNRTVQEKGEMFQFKKEDVKKENVKMNSEETKEDQEKHSEERKSNEKQEKKRQVPETEIVQNLSVIDKEDAVLKALSTDSIDINPFKKCKACKMCKICSGVRTSIVRNEEQEELIKKLKEKFEFNEKTQRYKAEYPHNQMLKKLRTNEKEALKMMELLERRLVKNNLAEKFNEQIEKLVKSGVYKRAKDIPEAEKLQQSYIVLTYTLHKKDEKGNDKLRVCSNSAYHSGDNLSFNDTCLPCPNYLNHLEGVLQLVKTRKHFSYADVQACYHNTDISLLDASLRRVWLRSGGMGSQTPWESHLTMRVNFGDVLGGPVASLGIEDALEVGVEPELASEVTSLNIMDDLATIEDDKEALETNKKKIETALESRGLPLSEWTTNGDDVDKVKYLSYWYSPRKDCFSVRVKFNLSPVKRGSKAVPDVKDPDQVDEHVQLYPWTRRRLAGLCASFMHDPTGYLGPLNANLKFFTREVTELQAAWDTLLPEGIGARITTSVKIMLQAEALSFPRQALFSEAAEISIDLYFDASMVGVGVVIAAKNTFSDGKIVYRFLKSKSKLNGRDIANCPRAELISSVVCVRLYNILLQDLNRFIKTFKGKLNFRVIGDSQIVLAQIQKPHYVFKTWAASRILEIKELIEAAENKVEFLYCHTTENFSDVLTRPFSKSPSQIPWTTDLKEPVSLKVLKPSKKPLTEYPEINLKKVINIQNNFQSISALHPISDQFRRNEGGEHEVTLQDVVLFAVVHQAAGEQEDEEEEEPPDDLETLVDHLLDQFSSYFRIRNTLSYVFYWRVGDWGLARKKAEEKIFQAQQQQCLEYMRKFRGNEFKTVIVDGVTYVRGRKTINGTTYLYLVPPDTKLYNILAVTYHKKYHRKGIYIRGQLLRDGYYLPSALHKLKSVSNACAFCRRRDRVEMEAEMGALGSARLGPGPEGGVFHTVQADVYGPLKIIKDFVNQRGPTRRGYVLVIICEFSRAIILHPLEGLSKQNLLDALETVFFRYGRMSKIRSDFGSNFVSVREELAGTGDVIASDAELREFSSQMRSRGTEIELKAPHMPWASAGGAESMNKNIFKCMGEVKQSFTAFQFIRFLEKCQFLINERPISLSNTLEVLCPNDVSSLHTKIRNVNSLEEFLQKSDENVKLFTSKWMDLYMSSLYSQRKWFTSSKIEKGSLLLILDTKNEFNYPSLGILKDIEEGTTDDVDRYFMVEHKTKTGQTRILRRPAQQLSLVLAKSEMGGDPDTADEEDLGDDDDDDDPGNAPDPSEDINDDEPLVRRPLRGPPITREQLFGNDETDEDGDRRDENLNVTTNNDESADDGVVPEENTVGESSHNDELENVGGDEAVAEDDEQVENVNKIRDVDTDQESQNSAMDSDGDTDQLEEDLGAGPFQNVNDNVAKPVLKVQVPVVTTKITNMRKKPKRKNRKK